MIELLYGAGDGSALTRCAAFDQRLSEELTLDDVDIFYSLFEVNMDRARELIPVSLHPSVPAAMGVTFWRAKSGPLGPFTVAFSALACRTGIKPRHLVLNAYVSSDTAQSFFGERYGFVAEIADVRFEENYDRFHGAVYHKGELVLETETTNALPLVGGGVAVKYSPPLNAVTINGEDLLVQFEAGYDFKRAARGTPKLTKITGPIAPTWPVLGTHAVCDVHFLPARFTVDINTPAEAGGAQKIKR